ncbi:MAG: cupin domain-containing protein [Thermoplasmata archaeon]
MMHCPEITVSRLVADEQGQSHFAEIVVPTSSTDFAPPAPPLCVSSPTKTQRHVFLVVPVGWYGEPHPSPTRQIFSVLRGTIEVRVSDGERRRYTVGDFAILEDTSGKGHATRNVGSNPALLSITQI